MNFRNAMLLAAAPLALTLPLLGGCSLEAAMATCAQCGEIRAISVREVTRDIHLLTDAPRTIATRAGAPVVYDIRVKMDRGGSRDLVLSSRERLRIGDRIEIRDGRVIPVTRTAGLGLT